MPKLIDLGPEIDSVDEECKRYLSSYTPESNLQEAKEALKQVTDKVLGLWKLWHGECGHPVEPFALLEDSASKPTVYLTNDGRWVILTLQAGSPRVQPRSIDLEELAQLDVKHTDIVRSIRRRLHHMSIRASSTQKPGAA